MAGELLRVLNSDRIFDIACADEFAILMKGKYD